MNKKNRNNGEEGFSLFDVIIAIMICSIGILAMTGALTANLIRANGMTKQIIAKQIAGSTLESVFSAREVRNTNVGLGGSLEGWNVVGNVGSNPDVNGVAQGVFLTGWRPVRENNGRDGVAGTADDACAAAIPLCPGETAANPVISGGIERQIVITDINDPLISGIHKRRIDIFVRHKVSNLTFNETISSLIADYQ